MDPSTIDPPVALNEGATTRYRWFGSNWSLLLSIIILAGIYVFYFGILKIFYNGQLSTWTWAWRAWNPENNYEHAKLLPIVVLFLVWHKRNKLGSVSTSSSKAGWF